MSSIQPRKQRKAWYNAPLHIRRKQMASHLSEDLLLKYDTRRTPVVVGDEVQILRGDHRGETGRVLRVDTKARKVVIDGITHKKADGTDVAMPVDPSNLLITKLNLEDKRRRAKLGEEAPTKKAAKAPSEGKSDAGDASQEGTSSPSAAKKPAKSAPKKSAKSAPKKSAKPGSGKSGQAGKSASAKTPPKDAEKGKTAEASQ